MPGTIQISVLDIVDLPHSSAPPSSTYIRVNMGRREYKAPANGGFSIPLTTLRENLIVKLVDGEGHEIAHTGVETRLVVEKGVWDEVFHLEGGGKMHLKIQFVLNEEEQSRIRMMRLSALKKKQGELVNDSSKVPDGAAAAGRDAATPLPRTREILGSPIGKEDGPTQSVLAPQSLKLQNDAKSEVTKAKNPSQMLMILNNPDKSEDPSAVAGPKAEASIAEPYSSEVLDTLEKRKAEASVAEPDSSEGLDKRDKHITEASMAEPGSSEVLDKRVKRSPPDAATMRGIPGEKVYASSSSSNTPATSAKSSSSFSAYKVEHSAARITKMRASLEKTPRNVRKMISAFETSLSQDKRHRIKPPLTKPKPSKPETEDLRGSQQSKEQADEIAPEVGPTGVVMEPDSSSQEAVYLESSMRNTEEVSILKDQHPAIPENAYRAEEMESASIPERALEKETSDGEQSQKAKTFTFSKNDKISSLCYNENTEEYSCEGSREWMFLDEPSNFCVTTGGKKMMHLMEGQSIETSNFTGNRNITTPYTLAKQAGVIRKSDVEMNNRRWETSSPYRQMKPESGRSAEDDHSGGPLGQAMKIAIMAGFGALVLFTRQRKDR